MDYNLTTVDAGERQDKDSDAPGLRRDLGLHQVNNSEVAGLRQHTVYTIGLTNNGKESRRFNKRSTPDEEICDMFYELGQPCPNLTTAFDLVPVIPYDGYDRSFWDFSKDFCYIFSITFVILWCSTRFIAWFHRRMQRRRNHQQIFALANRIRGIHGVIEDRDLVEAVFEPQQGEVFSNKCRVPEVIRVNGEEDFDEMILFCAEACRRYGECLDSFHYYIGERCSDCDNQLYAGVRLVDAGLVSDLYDQYVVVHDRFAAFVADATNGVLVGRHVEGDPDVIDWDNTLVQGLKWIGYMVTRSDGTIVFRLPAPPNKPRELLEEVVSNDHDAGGDDDDLVGVEENPGPQKKVMGKSADLSHSADYLIPEFENLRSQNCSRNKKPKRNILQERKLQRNLDELKKRLKSDEKKRSPRKLVWEPQMGLFSFDVVHKLSGDDSSELTNLLSKILEVVGDVKGEDLTEKVENLSKGAGGKFVDGAVTEATSKISNVIRALGTKLFGSDLSLAYLVLSSALLVFMYKKDFKIASMVAVGVVLALVGDVLGVNIALKNAISTSFSKTVDAFTQMSDVEGFVPQVGGISPEIMSEILCSGLLFTMFPKTNFSAKAIGEFFMNFGRVRGNMEEIVSFVMKLIQRGADFVSNSLGFDNFNIVLSSQEDVNGWVVKTRSLIDEVAKGLVDRDRVLYDRVYQLEESAYTLLTKYHQIRHMGSIGLLVRPLQLELMNMRRGLELNGVWNDKLRAPPVIVAFCGESQIGKSRMLRPFANALVAAIGDENMIRKAEANFDGIVYSRQPEHVYWDGYVGQEICFFDEFNVVNKALLTQENAQMDLIRCGNVFDNCLHMAELERKGTTYFRSKIIMCTSNSATVEDGAKDTVSYPDAVVNRIHYEVLVTVDEAFATVESKEQSTDPKHWRLDKAKLPSSGEFCYEVLNFNIRQRAPSKTQPGKMVYLTETKRVSFKELVLMCAEVYKRNESMAEQLPKDDVRARENGRLWRAQNEVDRLVPQMGCDDARDELALAIGVRSLDSIASILSSVSSSHDDLQKSFEFLAIGGSEVASVTNDIMKNERMSLVLSRYYACLGDELFKAFLPFIVESRGEYLADVAKRMKWVVSFDMVKEYFHRKRDIIFNLINSSSAKVNFGFSEILSYFGNVSTGTWKLLLVGLGSLGVCYTLGRSLFEYFGEQSDDKARSDEHFRPEVGDPALEDIATSLWQKNWYTIKENNTKLGYGFFLEGHTFAFVGHFLDIWKARGYEGMVDLIPSKGPIVRVSVLFLRQNSKATPCTDLVVCHIPNSRVHKDISSFIVGADILIKRNRGNCLMVKSKDGSRYDTFTDFRVTHDVTYNVTKDAVVKHPVSIAYNALTKTGDCGAPIFLIDSTTRTAKLIGIHVAGSPKSQLGLASVLHPMKDLLLEPQVGVVEGEPVHRFVETVDRGAGSTGVSRIVKSPLHGSWHTPAKMPAHLKSFINADGERISPMKVALAKYNTKLLRYDQTLVDVCARAAVSNVETVIRSRGLPLGKISREEVILGRPGVPFYDSINRKSSPGYPWNMNPRPGYSGKERFFGKGVDLTLDGPDWKLLEANLDQIEAEYFLGKRSRFIFADALKDELRPIEKVEKGSTRLFCPCPIEYLILFNVYFKSFFSGMMECRIEVEPTIGINPYSGEWEQLRRRLVRFGDGFLNAGDFGSFDALESAQILESIGEAIIDTFDDPEFNGVRRLLWKEVFNSFHLSGREIIEWLQSLPSGHGGTSGINCLFVGTVFRMIWVIAHDNDLKAVRSFEDNISLSDFGDDHVLNVAEPARELINQHTLPVLFGALGLIYTAEDKTSSPPKFRSISEIEFLKRTFRYEPRYGRHCAPLRLETILEMPYWTKVGMEEEIARTNVDTAIRELAMHDVGTFEKWVPQIVDASRRKLHYVPLIIDRDVLLDEIAQLDVHY